MIKNQFHNILFSCINDLIVDDYVFLDLPYYPNIGDVLIWEATIQLLKKIPHRCVYSCSIETYRKPQIKKNTILLFSGGGNFGDLWETHQKFRHMVMTDFPENPIVQLPQSVWFEDKANLLLDVQYYQKHRAPVTICLRDQQSFDTINKNYVNVRTLLLPDLVLALDIDKVLKRNKLSTSEGVGTLFFRRDDKELVDKKLDVSFDACGDWPCRHYTLKWIRKYNKLIKQLEKMRVPAMVRFKITELYYRYIIKDAYLRNGIRFLMPFHTIYATRLHAAILGVLLGKQVFLIDNSYHKNKGVFDLWLKKMNNISMI